MLCVRPLLPNIQKSPALRRLLRRHRLYSPAARKRFGHPHSHTHTVNAMNASACFFVQSRTLAQARGAEPGLNRAAVENTVLSALHIIYCGASLYCFSFPQASAAPPPNLQARSPSKLFGFVLPASSPSSPRRTKKSPALRRLLRRHRLYSPAARKRFGHPHSCTHHTNAMNASTRFFVQSRALAQARGAVLHEKRHLSVSFIALVGLNRLELSTSRLSGVCSNQLSYNP